ncbi:tRNA (guanine(6)-N(2))-methyltransferase THUMP3 [Ascaphus truei]|uniref:tRNA (guanine(6)-N(2))-methyltransferase THUMP3 n=1 Tax=Ascaphus truei TaxID=8439 RepID=UPI003F5A31D3
MSDVDAVADSLKQVILGDGDPVPHHVLSPDMLLVTIGATVPTGFEFTAAEEVKEKLGCHCKISKDRGKIYFQIGEESLAQVHHLRSVDNLFVIVQEFTDFPFNESKEAALQDFQKMAEMLPWERALGIWKLNNTLKKKKKQRKKPGNGGKERKPQPAVSSVLETPGGQEMGSTVGQQEPAVSSDLETAGREETGGTEKQQPAAHIPGNSAGENLQAEGTEKLPASPSSQAPSPDDAHGNDVDSQPGSQVQQEVQEGGITADAGSVLKFRVTCNRAGDKHSFTSNEAARDFGGAVQEHFQWKADMTNFDVEVLLNISYNEMLVGIALTEESLHRRNITHFGPTTLRSTLAYGMLRLCNLQTSDVVIDPMCGTGAIPIEGVSEWPGCFFLAGDNNSQAVKRAASNIISLLRKQQSPESAPQGLQIDAVHWDISSLPLRSGSVDVIITDLPFGKRIGSKKKNWDLYPSCLREMSRVCRAGSGRAVLLTHDRKCFIKALAKAGHLWRKVHTVWVNIGGLHAGVYLLKRTSHNGARDAAEED